jgi:hypothetical protein
VTALTISERRMVRETAVKMYWIAMKLSKSIEVSGQEYPPPSEGHIAQTGRKIIILIRVLDFFLEAI